MSAGGDVIQGARDRRGAITLALCVLAGVYLVLRAKQVAFTDDEVTSSTIAQGVPTYASAAGNQLVNTVLMGWSHHLFGVGDLRWRLPNLLSFPLYAATAIAFARSLRGAAARLTWVALVFGDLFLLEFFALARGYGISLAFSLLALVGLLLSHGEERPGRRAGWGAGIGLACLISFYANFSALNLVLGVLAAWAVTGCLRVWRLHGAARPIRPALAADAVPLAITAGMLIPGIIRLEWLQNAGQLYYGGHVGFIGDTVETLAMTFGYHYQFGPGLTLPWWSVALTVLTIGVAVMSAGHALVDGVAERRWGRRQVAALVLAISVLVAEAEVHIAGGLFPIDRAALTYVLAFAALVALEVNALLTIGRARRVVQIAVALTGVGVAANAIAHLNLDQTPTWKADAPARTVVQRVITLEHQVGRPAAPWTLVASFPLNFSLEYYRQLYRIDWLAPIGRGAPTDRGELYYLPDAQVAQLTVPTRLIANYPLAGTQLRATLRVR